LSFFKAGGVDMTHFLAEARAETENRNKFKEFAKQICESGNVL